MDIHETRKAFIGRHPWELSRTQMLIKVWSRYIEKLHTKAQESLTYVNIGAGDMYFDEVFLRRFPEDEVFAADIGYDIGSAQVIRDGRKHLVKDIDSLPAHTLFDYAVMMDSLEYMEDDKAYVSDLIARLKPGGYLFLTVPAYTKLFSEHDVHVKNLRRYDKKEVLQMLRELPEIELMDARHFYFSLFLVRWFQVALRLKIDPQQKVTTGWKYQENHPLTRLVKGVLNFDFLLGRHFPGLSLMVICKKR